MREILFVILFVYLLMIASKNVLIPTFMNIKQHFLCMAFLSLCGGCINSLRGATMQLIMWSILTVYWTIKYELENDSDV